MALTVAPPAKSTEKRDALVGRLFQSAIEGAEVLSIWIGDRLGLYATLHTAGPLTSAQLAARSGTDERYTREWLEQQTVAGFVESANIDGAAGERTYTLPEEYVEIFLDFDSPVHLAPFAELFGVLAARVPDVVDAFRTGAGVAYDRYGLEVRRAQERVNRPLYVTLLPHVWLPEIPDVHTRLQSDPPARVADIGCGAGWASIAIAQAYPKVVVDGFDNDEPSITTARANAVASGVADRVHFHLRDVSHPGLTGQYDVVTAFMMVHDVARPVETLANMRRLAGASGTVLVMDMRVSDTFTAPGSPAERFAYASSLLYCLPVSLADEPSAGTGTVMRTSTFRKYAEAAGFREVFVLPIEHDFFRFYRLVSDPLLAEFDAAASGFFDAFGRVPDEALAFRPEGDDYALSGLLIHVAGSLEFYAYALSLIADADFGPVTASGAPSPADVALTGDGITANARAATLERVRAAHAAVVTQVRRIRDTDRKAPVRFGEAADPLPTSASDIVGWVREHYREHIAHIDELLAKWRAGS